MIERFIPGAGGVENVAWQVAHELARAGESVTVLTRETHDAAEPRDGQPGCLSPPTSLTVVPVHAPRFWQPLRLVAFDRATARRARPRDADGPTGKRPFDVVHGFSRTRWQDLYRAGGGSHADYLRRTHGPLGRALRTVSPRHRLLLHHERRVFADPQQRIQCSSRLVADALVAHEGVDPDRILLLPNGVDAAGFDTPALRASGAQRRIEAEQREKTQLGPRTAAGPLWLFAGSGWRRKGLDRVLEALALEPLASHRLFVAGRDRIAPWRQRADRLGITDRIAFLGARDDLEILYHAVDALVLPTRYDPFANVTLEAAAAGLPIVTTESNGASEWLGEGLERLPEGAGLEALARAMQRLESPERRLQLGESAQKRAEELSWSRHVETLREEYRHIVSRRTGGDRR